MVMLYAQLHFGWSPEKAGILITVWGIVQFASMHFLALSDKRCGATARAGCERVVSWIGLITGFVGMLLMAGSFYDWFLVLGMGVGAVSMVTYTALTSYAGRLVDPSMSGEVQGLVGTVLDCTEVLGPPFFGAFMRWSLSPGSVLHGLPGAPFLFGSFAVLVAMIFMVGLPSLEDALAKLQGGSDRTAVATADTAVATNGLQEGGQRAKARLEEPFIRSRGCTEEEPSEPAPERPQSATSA